MAIHSVNKEPSITCKLLQEHLNQIGKLAKKLRTTIIEYKYTQITCTLQRIPRDGFVKSQKSNGQK